MAGTAAEVADALRAASHDRARSSEVLAGLFADEVVLRHDPPTEHDGPVPGAALADAVRQEAIAVERALPDAVHVPPEILVDGDDIRMTGTLSGRLPDGTEVELVTRTVLSIADGGIVALTSDMDAASAEIWGALLAAGAGPPDRSGA